MERQRKGGKTLGRERRSADDEREEGTGGGKEKKSSWAAIGKKALVVGAVLLVGYLIFSWIGSACSTSDSGLCKFANGVGNFLGAVGGALSWIGNNFQILLFLALGALGIYAGWSLISPRAKDWGKMHEALADADAVIVVTADGKVALSIDGKLVVGESGDVLRLPEKYREMVMNSAVVRSAGVTVSADSFATTLSPSYDGIKPDEFGEKVAEIPVRSVE